MPAYYDAAISGDGSAALVGGTSVLYVAVHVTAIGSEAREIEATATDHFLRFGWFALGRTLTLPTDIARVFWMRPEMINFVNFRWTPDPNNTPTGVASISASDIRWHLSTGAAARLYVFGA